MMSSRRLQLPTDVPAVDYEHIYLCPEEAKLTVLVLGLALVQVLSGGGTCE